MQPHPPQLPTDNVAASAPKNWLKPVLWLVLAVAAAALLAALLLPKKQVEGRNAPPPTEHRAQSPAYSNPNLTP